MNLREFIMGPLSRMFCVWYGVYLVERYILDFIMCWRAFAGDVNDLAARSTYYSRILTVILATFSVFHNEFKDRATTGDDGVFALRANLAPPAERATTDIHISCRGGLAFPDGTGSRCRATRS